jgi:quercetin dioxygenase-like cupin family protein
VDRPVVEEHPQKRRLADVPVTTMSPEHGWVDMAVQWVVTREAVGAERTVFGVTRMPPGARHDIHRHANAEEVEYLVQGEGLARVGEVDVRMRAGDVVFVAADEPHGFHNTSATEEAVIVWCYGGAPSLDEAGYQYQPDTPEHHPH